MILILKAKAAAQGETRTWKDGKTREKVGKKWVIVSEGKKAKVIGGAEKRAKDFYNYAMTTNLGNIIEDVMLSRNLIDYEGLINSIKEGPADTAHKIYKEVVDRVKAIKAPVGDKKAIVDLFGRSLIQLKELYSTKPKVKLTITKTSKQGKEYRGYEEGKHGMSLPVMKASRVKTDKKKMGGWSVTGALSTIHIRAMLKTNAAKIISGTPNGKRKWILPKKGDDMELKYKGDGLVIHVKQIVKKKERTRATAKADIEIPYTFAKAFLLNQIASKRTRNNFIFRMEHSKGYRDYMEKYGS
jgi:hypothetical protein